MRVPIAAAIVALTAATPAPAQFFPQFDTQSRAERDLDRQIDDVYRRIEDARGAGRLTEREARDYHRVGQRIFDRFSYARRDGIDRWEFRDISREADGLVRRLDQRLRYDESRTTDRAPVPDRRADAPWGKPDPEGDWRSDDIWADRPSDDREWAGWPPPSREPDDYARDDDFDDEGDYRGGGESEPPRDDWWLPPEERETIERRPGDRPD